MRLFIVVSSNLEKKKAYDKKKRRNSATNTSTVDHGVKMEGGWKVAKQPEEEKEVDVT